ncbi:MAG: TetR/AcrR family transcriptional regulator [Actinomycetota bacterium]|nr:TetR/AcrR family transcriptional regulator [Actinomycetota bacterium]
MQDFSPTVVDGDTSEPGASEPGAPGRRARKKAETRRALHQAAVRLVRERGLADVTVEDITDAADVSARTFFNYFTCKEDALVGAGGHLGDELAEALAARPATEPVLRALGAVLGDVIGRLVDAPDRWEDWAARMELVHRYPAQLLPRQLAMFADFERTVVGATARRSGTDPETDLYPAVVGAVAVALTKAAFSRWRQGDPGQSLVDLLDEAFALVEGGLSDPGPTQARARRTRSRPRVPAGDARGTGSTTVPRPTLETPA